MKIAGFDIGGANTDLGIVDFVDGEIKNIEVDFAYLPMWSRNDDLCEVLIELIEKICPISEIDAVGISMTAELVDAYDTKKEGVLDIVDKCEKIRYICFYTIPIMLLEYEYIKQVCHYNQS